MHIDIAEVPHRAGQAAPVRRHRTRASKFAFVQRHDKATRRIAADFLRAVAEAMPFKIHTVLTDNREAIPRRDVSKADRSVQFTQNLPDRSTPEQEAAIDAYRAARDEPRVYLVHAFNHACARLGIRHRTTQALPPVDIWPKSSG